MNYLFVALLVLFVAPVSFAHLETWLRSIPINRTAIIHNLKELATHNDLTPPSVQRILFTESDLSARAFIRALMTDVGLSIREDAIGNLFATWHGSSDQPPVLTGSHIDAIPHSGMYDGTLGVLAALEAMRALRATGFRPRRSVAVLAFASEEPTRFGLSCIGSRLLAGTSSPLALAAMRDARNISLEEARRQAGLTGDLADVELDASSYSAFVELHIEQASSLERTNVSIGAVTGIAAPATLDITLRGDGGHAGALPMSERHDALLAASRVIANVERAALRASSQYAVATVGKVEVFPGAVNSVPREVRLSVDVRDVDGDARDAVLHEITEGAREAGAERGVEVDVQVVNQDAPATCDDVVVAAVDGVARAVGLTATRMVSRAYHDALFMARKMPVGMIFVPCRDGVSHRPDEFVEERDIENGARVLAGVLAELAGDAGEANEEDKSEL